ncbi:22391_t:CDS:2, partial [Gigaspora margarita]
RMMVYRNHEWHGLPVLKDVISWNDHEYKESRLGPIFRDSRYDNRSFRFKLAFTHLQASEKERIFNKIEFLLNGIIEDPPTTRQLKILM